MINAVVDENGLPLRIVLSAGQASDKAAVAALLDGLPPARALVADRGYDARAIIEMVRQRGGEAHVPPSVTENPAFGRSKPLSPAQSD
jgi:transposase